MTTPDSAGDIHRRRVRFIQIAEAWGGVEHNTTQLASRLADKGHSVVVTAIGEAAYSKMPPAYRGMFELEEIPWPPHKLPTFPEWLRLMRARPADVLVLPKNWWAKGGLAMIWAAGVMYPRVVVTEHVAVPVLPRPARRRIACGLLPAPNLWWRKHLAYGRLLSLVPRRIICVSSTVRQRLVDQCGFPPDRTVVVHNGVDTRLFAFSSVESVRVREELGIGRDATVIGSIGRLDNATKRHDWSLQAFARVAAEMPRHRLHMLLVGEGPDRSILESMASDLDISSRVTFAPFTHTPWRFYSALDVFLMPSAFEAFGLSLVEAMSCARCCIASRVDGIEEILNEPGIGLAVDPHDFEAFVGALRHAVEIGVEARTEMGRSARESVRKRFDADRQYEKIIMEVLG